LFLVYSKRLKELLSEILFLEDAELETINLLYEYAPDLRPARETTGVTQAEAHRRIPPYKGEKPYVFVSYAHRDMADAMPIIRFLQEKGVRVWYDEGIDPGTEWDDNIASHIKDCRAFIALLSAFYLESSNCKDELSYARDLDKKRLLIYLNDKFEMPDGIAMRTNRLQNIHKYKYTEETAFQEKLLEMDGLADCIEKEAVG
ncbi:MAG: toll/interleukin-1 receptor domain-containing protein, partial [Lachnospiraceae bacterium]|nr:toll/interleukin-1 receptor domain-containing protein [Lachnospiraceae bacterium]